ncbi:hypothetical protein BBJ28_00022086, partial [Nothophytophthora sp. Chile5]
SLLFLPPKFMASGIVGSRAIPTNNWWGNMIAATGDDPVVQPVWANPYSLTPSLSSEPFGLTVSYPYPTRVFGGGFTGNGNAEAFYRHGHVSDFTFSAVEFSAIPVFEVFDWDDLSVQVRFYSPSSADRTNKSRIQATLVSGMAFVTAKYTTLTPHFTTVYAILTVNGLPTTSKLVITDTRFVLTLNNGQTWTLYFSSPVTVQLQGLSTLAASSPFTGTIRIALIPDTAKQHIFDKAATCILEGGSVEARDASSYAYVWKTSGDCSASNGLLHYAQLHHVDTLDRSTAVEAQGITAYSTTRGIMQALLTTTPSPVWQFADTTVIPVTFYPPRPPTASVVAAFMIKESLLSDISSNWSIPLNGSYYFNGKAAQKYASLCLMAADVAVTGSDSTALLTQCLTKLERVLAPFLTNSWTYELQYDSVYRGILSSQGFALNDANADFGNTMYNDHHYHYGYWIVTAAIVNKLAPSWVGVSELNRMTRFLIRDVANPSWKDPHFPKFRNFDWYRGHSYSHGITSFADGKDQESASEDVNFHYGVALFGQVTGDLELAAVGQLMVKLNARAIQTYFLLTDGNRAQPSRFKPNKVTGILFDNKVTYSTWFSPQKYAIHGIQMIPISPITEYVRTLEFVTEEWEQVLSKTPIVVNEELSNPWLSLLYANYATVDKHAALQKLQEAKMDDGLSRSWALYMAATRPDRVKPSNTTTT